MTPFRRIRDLDSVVKSLTHKAVASVLGSLTEF